MLPVNFRKFFAELSTEEPVVLRDISSASTTVPLLVFENPVRSRYNVFRTQTTGTGASIYFTANEKTILGGFHAVQTLWFWYDLIRQNAAGTGGISITANNLGSRVWEWHKAEYVWYGEVPVGVYPDYEYGSETFRTLAEKTLDRSSGIVTFTKFEHHASNMRIVADLGRTTGITLLGHPALLLSYLMPTFVQLVNPYHTIYGQEYDALAIGHIYAYIYTPSGNWQTHPPEGPHPSLIRERGFLLYDPRYNMTYAYNTSVSMFYYNEYGGTVVWSGRPEYLWLSFPVASPVQYKLGIYRSGLPGAVAWVNFLVDVPLLGSTEWPSGGQPVATFAGIEITNSVNMPQRVVDAATEYFRNGFTFDSWGPVLSYLATGSFDTIGTFVPFDLDYTTGRVATVTVKNFVNDPEILTLYQEELTVTLTDETTTRVPLSKKPVEHYVASGSVPEGPLDMGAIWGPQNLFGYWHEVWGLSRYLQPLDTVIDTYDHSLTSTGAIAAASVTGYYIGWIGPSHQFSDIKLWADRYSKGNKGTYHFDQNYVLHPFRLSRLNKPTLDEQDEKVIPGVLVSGTLQNPVDTCKIQMRLSTTWPAIDYSDVEWAETGLAAL